jgi:hypothetical protein
MARGKLLSDVEQYVLEMNQLCEGVLALRRRGTRIWNRAAHGAPPLTNVEIQKMRAALKRLQTVART